MGERHIDCHDYSPWHGAQSPNRREKQGETVRKILARYLPQPVKSFLRGYILNPGRWSWSFRSVPLRLAPEMRMDLVRGDLISEAISATGVWEPQTPEQLAALA